MGVLQGVKPTYIQFQHFEGDQPREGRGSPYKKPPPPVGGGPLPDADALPTSMCHFQALTSSPYETSAPKGMAGPLPLSELLELLPGYPLLEGE